MPHFASIIRVAVPSPLRRLFDYLPGTTQPLQPGMRVKVPFGRKYVVGVIAELADQSDLPHHKLKSISKVFDTAPLFSARLLTLLMWAADYYQYSLGEVLQQAMPILLRQGQAAEFEQESRWQLTILGAQIEREEMRRAPKQWQVIEKMRELAPHSAEVGITVEALALQGITKAQLNLLESKKLVIEKKHNKIKLLSSHKVAGPLLNAEQQQATQSIVQAQNRFECFLLQGITGSGKTEVYLMALQNIIANGGQALILVPEIGLTPQTIARFSERLNCPIALLHSGLSDKERLNSCLLAKNGDVSVVIGTRSAVFTAFANLKCIIIDEEHDASFKQWDGFRYHARDLAIRRAQLENIPVVLGSATPSLASLHNVAQGKYTSLLLTTRATGAALPKFQLVDLRRQTLQDGFAPGVLHAIEQHLQHGNQVLIFLNRRGFAPVVLCHECGWVAECQRCHTPMTKHFAPASLQCHHCGKHSSLPKRCVDCSSEQLLDVGLGTEKVEQVLQKKFPKYTVARIDRDSVRKKGALETKLHDIHTGHAQILVGTQMLAKGHHFPNVTLVVLLDTDGGLYSADFSASERMAQLLLQVAGRAGREEKPGTVLVQTHHPEHPLLQSLISGGYAAFAEQALQERRAANLPPYCHLVLLRVEAVDDASCEKFLLEAQHCLANAATAAVTIFDSVRAPIEKRVGRHRWQLLLASQQRKALHTLLKTVLPVLESSTLGRKVRWSIDVDPIEML